MLTLSVTFVGLFFNLTPSSVIHTPDRGTWPVQPPAKTVLLLFVMDHQALLCDGCNQATLTFLEALQKADLPGNVSVMGIMRMVSERGSGADEGDLRVAQQKLWAFRHFNKITFPILMDTDCGLCDRRTGNSGVTVFNTQSGLTQTWEWSETRSDFARILHFLKGGAAVE